MDRDNKMMYLSKKHIIGKVRANLPYVGILTIWLNDYPPLKYAMIGSMFLLVMIAKDP
jgi:signal peptidase